MLNELFAHFYRHCNRWNWAAAAAALLFVSSGQMEKRTFESMCIGNNNENILQPQSYIWFFILFGWWQYDLILDSFRYRWWKMKGNNLLSEMTIYCWWEMRDNGWRGQERVKCIIGVNASATFVWIHWVNNTSASPEYYFVSPLSL